MPHGANRAPVALPKSTSRNDSRSQLQSALVVGVGLVATVLMPVVALVVAVPLSIRGALSSTPGG